MDVITLGRKAYFRLRAATCAGILCLLAACSSSPPTLLPADQPLTKETMMLLGKKGMDAGAPIFIRIFKEESELEVWKARDDGRYYHFKTYPICNWSGDLGPKTKQGDKQAPEGFYSVTADQMKPDSNFYLAFNLGYPNSFDRAQGHTGEFLMVHGKCKSAGCYAMTDALIEEIYALAREAILGGQQSFQVHAFPFRMTYANMTRYKKHPAQRFWAALKQGYDHFERYRVPPTVAVCERRYVVNVVMPSWGRVDPEGMCPAFQRPVLQPFVPKPSEQQIAEERITIPGPKVRDADVAAIAAAYGAPPAQATSDAPSLAAAVAGTSSSDKLNGASALGFSQ